MRGHRPKPYLVKKGSGNPGKRPLSPGPRYKEVRARCPKSLVGEARRIYNRLSKVLNRQGLLNKGTFDCLIMLCRIGGMAADLEKILRKKGYTIRTERGIRNRPEVGMFQKASVQFRHYLNEFGLPPASVQRVPTRQRIEPLEDLLRD